MFFIARVFETNRNGLNGVEKLYLKGKVQLIPDITEFNAIGILHNSLIVAHPLFLSILYADKHAKWMPGIYRRCPFKNGDTVRR